MLTFGFEIEAQRLVLKRRERRLRRRIRAERLENHWIESCCDSEDGDAHFLARERQRQSRCRGGRRADASDLSSSEEGVRDARPRRDAGGDARARPPRTPGQAGAVRLAAAGHGGRAAGRSLAAAGALRERSHHGRLKWGVLCYLAWKRRNRAYSVQAKRLKKDVTTRGRKSPSLFEYDRARDRRRRGTPCTPHLMEKAAEAPGTTVPKVKSTPLLIMLRASPAGPRRRHPSGPTAARNAVDDLEYPSGSSP